MKAKPRSIAVRTVDACGACSAAKERTNATKISAAPTKYRMDNLRLRDAHAAIPIVTASAGCVLDERPFLRLIRIEIGIATQVGYSRNRSFAHRNGLIGTADVDDSRTD